MSKELEAARALVKMLEEREQSNKVKLESLKAGEAFCIGENDYIVLEQHEGKTKVISKDFIAENLQMIQRITKHLDLENASKLKSSQLLKMK